METVLTLAVTGILNVLCFIIGAKVGQTVNKGESVKMPNLNPLQAYRENRARKEAEAEMDKRNTVLRNIERYDGTGRGQEEVR